MDSKTLWDQQRLLVRGSNFVILDAGANEGQSAEKYQRWWPDATMHCFEPDPRAFKVLQSKWGKAKNVHLYPEALAAVEGRTRFYLGKESYASSALPNIPDYVGFVPAVSSIDVATTTLDKFLRVARVPYVNILKMDLQGFELEALKGARDILKEEVIDVIYTEVHINPVYLGAPHYWQVAQYLADFRYKTWNIEIVEYGSNIEGRWGDAIFISNHYARRIGY